MLLLIAWLGVATLELLVHMMGKWPRLRAAIAAMVIPLTGLLSGALLALRPNLFTIFFTLLSLYRIINMLRVFKRRMHEVYLRRATLRTSEWLVCGQAVVLVAWWAWQHSGFSPSITWSVLCVTQLGVAAVLFGSVRRNIQKTRWLPPETHYSDRELPSVTIAIPARNETEELQQCLESVIASDYPKLEILVLDDCSQTKRTPEIIKSFAQDGVRFVQGDTPKETWLPKNQAYHKLCEEASGAYLLFTEVDVRFNTDTVRKLVTTLLERKKTMLSVLPQHKGRLRGDLSLLQAMRYWWELVPPRRQFKRPPVISSCWIIARKALLDAGGFEAVMRSIVPEAYFARQSIHNDGYSFLRANDDLGIYSTKPLIAQRETAVRMRYPQLHRRPEQVGLFAALETLFLLLPYVFVLAGWMWHIGWFAYLAALVSVVLLTATYMRLAAATHLTSPLLSVVLFPAVIIADLIIVHVSMWQYEFSTVTWKGRNICIPAMHVVPRLPRLTANSE